MLARRLVGSGRARRVREAADLPRSAVARAAGVTPGAVRLWEHALRTPRGTKGAAYGAVLRELLESELGGLVSL
jgi:hypothetical protein